MIELFYENSLCQKIANYYRIKTPSSMFDRLLTLREKSLYLEFFWSLFFRICTEYRGIFRFFPYSVPMPENKDQKNFEHGDFSCM